MNERVDKHIVVLVLGDIGRSPRMQYHAVSLLEHGYYVTLVGYAGEGLIPSLENALQLGHLHVLRMKPYQPPRTNFCLGLLYYPLRLVSLLYCVIFTLWIQLQHAPHTNLPVDVVMVQNPPALPTLLLAYLYCIWQDLWKNRRPRFVIDWHNLGHSMFDSPNSQSSFHRRVSLNSVRIIVKKYECIMASFADAHLCVSQAMETWLGENFCIHGKQCVTVLYDRPPILFHPTTLNEQHELFQRLQIDKEEQNYILENVPHTNSFQSNPQRYGFQLKERTLHRWLEEIQQEQQLQQSVGDDDRTIQALFTQVICQDGQDSGSIQLCKNRPALIVSSTSWTPDEDFSILLEALDTLQDLINEAVKIDSHLNKPHQLDKSTTHFPKILVLVTGKGPQKKYFLPLLHAFNQTHSYIKIYTLWLEAIDYPTLLGCATLGVSLHTSTSGIDLPMKVLDMFGCEVPVCAMNFDCLGELVKDGVNGRVFRNANELANQLFELLRGYPDSDNADGELEKYRRSIRGMTRWKENWNEYAHRLIVGN